MQIRPDVPFLPNSELETRANALLERYHREIAPIAAPPVPVEQMADFLLELAIDWAPINDTDDDPVLAYIHAEERLIRLNEGRKEHFDRFMGTYEFTLAHELGHHELHMIDGQLEQIEFEFGQRKVFVCRSSTKDRRELQANLYAGYLLMPSHLLLPAIEDMQLRWPSLYRLRDTFNVSITALKIRLENLGRLYVDPDGRLHHSRQEAAGQLSLL